MTPRNLAKRTPWEDMTSLQSRTTLPNSAPGKGGSWRSGRFRVTAVEGEIAGLYLVVRG